MHHAAKIKIAAAPIPLRKSATKSAARRVFPAWIDAGERGVAFSAAAVTPRVRDALVLRTVSKRKRLPGRNSSDGPGAR
jgi:hypothetical protein